MSDNDKIPQSYKFVEMLVVRYTFGRKYLLEEKDDLVSEVWTELFGLGLLDDAKQVKRVVYKRIKQEVSRQKRYKTLEVDVESRTSALTDLAISADISSLSDLDKKIFNLLINGCTEKEIAEALGKSRYTIRVSKGRIKRKLK